MRFMGKCKALLSYDLVFFRVITSLCPSEILILKSIYRGDDSLGSLNFKSKICSVVVDAGSNYA